MLLVQAQWQPLLLLLLFCLQCLPKEITGDKVPTWLFPMVLPIPRAERELLTWKLKCGRSTLCCAAKAAACCWQLWGLSGGNPGQGEEQPSGLLEWSLVSGRRSILSDRQDFGHKLEFEISKGKKKKAEGTFACVEMTALGAFPWAFWALSRTFVSLPAHWAKCWWAEQGPQLCLELSCSGESGFRPKPIPTSLACQGKATPTCSGLGDMSGKEGADLEWRWQGPVVASLM